MVVVVVHVAGLGVLVVCRLYATVDGRQRVYTDEMLMLGIVRGTGRGEREGDALEHRNVDHRLVAGVGPVFRIMIVVVVVVRRVLEVHRRKFKSEGLSHGWMPCRTCGPQRTVVVVDTVCCMTRRQQGTGCRSPRGRLTWRASAREEDALLLPARASVSPRHANV